jgi:hypothetical protein
LAIGCIGFNVSPNSSICLTGNCEFEFEDGQINTDFSGDWVLIGRLKVGVETDEGTRSTLYDVRGDSVILPQDIEMEYEITNGTLTIEDEDTSWKGETRV